ncbi:FtsX-like permease family protein [Planctopirus ephydatiae]|uniref:FtsX-like permease family protein n=1 Tax=Planctopirus ephydatiae TaxID=2528019 RepID=A0A518GK58_9PLAN|nr:ABC transporter permease [Planctopirus ephydatiae]QDV29002.1 FtsX-like permease family protein [Planctopirus ephydatiae]
MPHSGAASLRHSQLIKSSLRYYWRTSLAVWLGVIAATAVVTGALLVGDSMRGSLRAMTLRRLGEVDAVITGPRFVREDLASRLQAKLKDQGIEIAPALMLRGGVEHQQSSKSGTDSLVRRAGQVMAYGVDERLWPWLDRSAPGTSISSAASRVAPPAGREALITLALAEALQARAGDTITLWVELPSAVPRDTLLGQKDNDSQEVTLTVREILPQEVTAAHFGLAPSQLDPLSLFMNHKTLQADLGLGAVRPSRRDPQGSPARVNAIFFHDSKATSPESALASQEDRAAVEEALRSVISFSDLQLRVITDSAIGGLSIDSERMLLEDPLAQAIQSAADKLKLASSPVMVYLANSIRKVGGEPRQYSMYSTVAGINAKALEPPFGPFPLVEPSSVINGQPATPVQLSGRGVMINTYLAEDLGAKVGDELELKWHQVGAHGELPEESGLFKVEAITKIEGPAADRHLTPEVKGITDVDSLSDWDQPFPMKLDLVTTRDDEYWDQYKALPKLFLSLQTAQQLWPSRYGTLTSIRLALPAGTTREAIETGLASQMVEQLDLSAAGLSLQPLKAYGLKTAAGATDFTGLFIGFSFFLIVAALILISLLFRLGVEQRTRELGLLAATGFTPTSIRWLLLCEGFWLACLGSLMGLLLGTAYARLMIYGLTNWWQGAIRTSAIDLYVLPGSLVMGAAIAIAGAMFSVWWALRDLSRIEIRDLLSGQSNLMEDQPSRYLQARWKAMTSGGISAVMILLLVAGVVPASEAFGGLSWQIVGFFASGMLLLATSLWTLSAWLDRPVISVLQGSGLAGITRLAERNVTRARQRSLLTVGMISAATFVIVTVAAGQRNPAADRPMKSSGNGGFALVGESASPILYDLNTPAGRQSLQLQFPAGSKEASLLDAMRAYQFRVKPGEDASCINLFQATAPTILGVPRSFIERGGFKFVGATGANPWELLLGTSTEAIPVIGDINTLLYSLKKGPGATLPAPEAPSDSPPLKIAGMLDGSVLQGVLLMSEENFLRLYPEQKGYSYFLIEVPPAEEQPAIDLLESRLVEYGLDLEPVGVRIARFLAVQNTYLAAFQALGGLGLLLGTIGLATVMLRNVWERQAELSLMRAIGFGNGLITRMILCENALLLVWGLCFGTVAALVSMLPQLLSAGADVPWVTGAAWLLLVFVVGMLSALAAVRLAVRLPLLVRA